jgi:hypothetical protein
MFLKRCSEQGTNPLLSVLYIHLLTYHHCAQLRATVETDSPKLQLLPQASEVLAVEQIGRRARVRVLSVTATNGSQQQENWTAVSGWASLHSIDGYPILQPLEPRAWQQWGRARMHVALCGHAVHQQCWNGYFATLRDKSAMGQVRVILLFQCQFAYFK